MADATMWWVLAGVLVALELMTGSVYLLMLGLGALAAALTAMAGHGLSVQLVVAAAVGGRRALHRDCLLYTSPSPRDLSASRMPSSA